MEASRFTPEHRQSLTRLLDDPAPAVRQALLAHFRLHPDESLTFLRHTACLPDARLAGLASAYLNELNLSDPVNEFRGFIRSMNYELETGALLLSRTVHPDLDVVAAVRKIDALAARCRELIVEPATARDRCRVLNRVLFHEQGFRGNTEHYADPRNSFLDQVLIRKQGLPISLSILYLLVAERAGLAVEPVGLPGHFVVGCYAEDLPFYIDAFNGGRFLTPEDAVLLLRQHGVAPTIADLAPTPVREVLCRCCRNLVNHYTAGGDPERARLFAEFVAEFESTHERHAQP